MRCTLNKIASVTRNLSLHHAAVLGDAIPAEEGAVVACRVLNHKTRYNTLEDVHGRMMALRPGDVIAGALGSRDALHGYAGRVPERVAVGDTLQLLNLGGVIGVGAGAAPGLGDPFQLEVLGAVLDFPDPAMRLGVPANIRSAALPPVEPPAALPPVIAFVGTAMDAGKTTAASLVIAELCRRGFGVAAGKLTGVSLRRDVLQMADNGASPVAVFTDFGVVTTTEANAVGVGRSMLGHLAESHPDLLVLEMGDGLLGTYGVHALLSDPVFRGALSSVVLCAQDPVGVWGADQLLASRYGLRAVAVTGPVTDSPVGRRFCQAELGVPGINALQDAGALAQVLVDSLVAEPVA
ncbi:MAG: hypothetical protein H8E31_15165 [Planctomycetes bacterium]|nr:hypothetical protein [Planctomycetota bacterium]